MSHFTVLVVGDNVDEQLAPFNENESVERYVKYTKEQLIAKGRKEIEDYKNGTYAEYLADPKAYELDNRNPRHIKYIRDEFPKKLNWSDEEVYKDMLQCFDDVGENGEVYSTYNPESKWDWYIIGGRWCGFFRIKPGGVGKRGEPSLVMHDFKYPEGYADIIYIGDIDFDYMRRKAWLESSIRYTDVEKALSGTPPHKPWSYFMEQREKGLITPIVAREEYWMQERCKLWEELDKAGTLKIGWGDSPDDYLITLEEYCERAVTSIYVPHAILYNGQWIERGEMGWWGILRSENKSEIDWDKSVAAFYKYLLSENPLTLLTIVDCHI